ncbi:hypothetical protein N7495_008876 [Penicillium taxi]|uniref:uncharacterized protein n=1 Tax=Penicillium taxi TaxID=168475 RepID=UPI0025451BAA|nr:uncharacterized protein N7495_008876 [Penicillium taxi]KAJ5888835.1 hypothetical protein N7495_008876 [Penicillium taxi]
MDSLPPEEDLNLHPASTSQANNRRDSASSESPRTIRGRPRLASGGSLTGRVHSANSSPLSSPQFLRSVSDEFPLSPALLNSPLMGNHLPTNSEDNGFDDESEPYTWSPEDETNSSHEFTCDASPDMDLWTPKRLRDLPKPIITPEKKHVKKLASEGSLTGRMQALNLTQSPVISPAASPITRFFGILHSGQTKSPPASPSSPTARFSKFIGQKQLLDPPDFFAPRESESYRNPCWNSEDSQVEIPQPELQLSKVRSGKGREKHVRFAEPVLQNNRPIRVSRGSRSGNQVIALPFTEEQYRSFSLNDSAGETDSESATPQRIPRGHAFSGPDNYKLDPKYPWKRYRAPEKFQGELRLGAIQNELRGIQKKEFNIHRKEHRAQEEERFQALRKEGRGMFYQGSLMDPDNHGNLYGQGIFKERGFLLQRSKTETGLEYLIRQENHDSEQRSTFGQDPRKDTHLESAAPREQRTIEERGPLPQGSQMDLNPLSASNLQKQRARDEVAFFPSSSMMIVDHPIASPPRPRSSSPGYNEAIVNAALAERIRKLPLKGRVLRKENERSEGKDHFNGYEPFTGNDPGSRDSTIR